MAVAVAPAVLAAVPVLAVQVAAPARVIRAAPEAPAVPVAATATATVAPRRVTVLPDRAVAGAGAETMPQATAVVMARRKIRVC